ncbi:hypothetical protein JL721_4154 [Aureococcus anophagefferens]|nr:hypothetical protein JL721_4154 [Aureococcus anophagefferens]
MATYKGKTYGREPEASEEYLPLRPPEWIPDASAPACMAATDLGVACGRPFDAFLEWRHHCRFCGRVVCGACSRRKMLLPGERWAPYAEADFDFSEPRRVCNYCCETLKPFQKRWAQRVARSHRPAMGTEDETLRYMNIPLPFYESDALEQEVQKAAFSLKNLTEGLNYWSGDEAYAAFIGGISFGSGLVVARRDDGTWSPPCAVGTYGLTGAVVGAEVTDSVHGAGDVAAELCDGRAKVSLGGAASLALGPLGRTGEAAALVSETGRTAQQASYSHSRGFFGGVTVDGVYVTVRRDVNHAFYGESMSADRLLRDTSIPQPNGAAELYAQLHKYIAVNHDYVVNGAPAARDRSPGRLRASSLEDDADLSDHVAWGEEKDAVDI